MVEKIIESPKVFVSYSWTTPEHEEWVVELSRRLMDDGIKVTLDKWDLKEGQDIHKFMESMVTSSDIDKVLIICDKGYKEKADQRIGGVGTETQIITPEIYTDTQQEKFIPVISERDIDGNHFIPSYMASRLYIDLSDFDRFEDNYERLLRNLFKVPLHQKPALGTPPEYLFNDKIHHDQTSKIIRKMKSVIDRFPNRLIGISKDFADSLYESLEQYHIKEYDDINTIDDIIINKIDEMDQIKNDYIEFLEMMCETNNIDSELLIEIFENIYRFSEFQGTGSYYSMEFEHFKFIITELFIYTTAILIRYNNYNHLSQLIHSEYFSNSKYKSKPLNFTDYRFYVESLEMRNKRLKLNRVSLKADKLIERVNKKYKQDFINADLLLYYLSKINQNDYHPWFPTTYIYFDRYNDNLKLLSRLKSKSYYNSVNILFKVESIDELKSKVNDFTSDRGYNYVGYSIPNIKHFIDPNEICSLP